MKEPKSFLKKVFRKKRGPAAVVRRPVIRGYSFYGQSSNMNSSSSSSGSSAGATSLSTAYCTASAQEE